MSWNGHTLHIVGLAIDPQNEVLVEGLRSNRSGPQRARAAHRRGARAYRHSGNARRRARLRDQPGAREPHALRAPPRGKRSREEHAGRCSTAISARDSPVTCRTSGRASTKPSRWIDRGGRAGGHRASRPLQDGRREPRGAARNVQGPGRRRRRSRDRQPHPRPVRLLGESARANTGCSRPSARTSTVPRESYRDLGDLPALPVGLHADLVAAVESGTALHHPSGKSAAAPDTTGRRDRARAAASSSIRPIRATRSAATSATRRRWSAP